MRRSARRRRWLELDAELRSLLGRAAPTPSRSSRTSSFSLREDTVNQALQTIERRVNELGVAEPLVARHSAADQILVQLPGVTDVNRAKEIIRSTAQLELKQVEQGPFSDEAAARQALGNNLPPDMQILPGTLEAGPGQPAGTGYYVVRRVPAVTGRDLRNARPTLDENNRPAVSFSLNQEGARKFGNFTQANIGKQLGDRAGQPRRRRRRRSSRASTTKAASPATSRRRNRRTSRWCCARARCRRT